MAEVNRRIAALKQSMANEIAHADISILTTGATRRITARNRPWLWVPSA